MPRIRSKTRQIECVLHPINVLEVSQKYANRIMANKGEVVDGGYVRRDATMYITREASERAKIHTVLHELYHAFKDHTARMDEEAAADSFAAMTMRIFKPETVEDLFMDAPTKGKK